MMPPPTMTTSALSTNQTPRLEDQLERGERRDVLVVDGGRDLDYVEANDLRALGRGAEQGEGLPGREATGRGNLGPGRERRIERVDVEGDVHLLPGQALGDLAGRSGQVLGQLGAGDEEDAVRLDEIELLRVEVPPARDDDARRLDARGLQGAPQRAAARPVAAAREVTQVGVRVDPQDVESGVAARLRRQGRDGGAVVASQDGEERPGWDVGQPFRHGQPAGLDLKTRVQVADVLDAQPGQQVPVLGHRRHCCRQQAHLARPKGGAFPVDGRAVVRDARDHDVGGPLAIALEPAPRAQTFDVHAHTLLPSGTFRMLSDPTTNHTANRPKTTGNPPGRPSSRGPALNASSRGPPRNTAMMPAPAVAMLEKPT